MTQLIDTSRLNLEIIGRAAWAACEDDHIRDSLPERGEPDYVALAVQLKRPVEIVVGRVKFLRKRRPKPESPQRHPRHNDWTPDMDAVLITAAREAEAIGKRPPWREYVTQLGKSYEAVKARARLLRFYGKM